MKKLLAILLFAFAIVAHALTANDIRFTQRTPDNTTFIARDVSPPAAAASAVMFFNGGTQLPQYMLLGTGLAFDSTTLSITGFGTSSFSGAYSDLTGKPTLGSAAALNVPTFGDAASGEVVNGADGRLTNARTPLPHVHPMSEISDSSAMGRSILTAADGPAVRSLTGAGTSSFSGDYAALMNKPAIPADQVNSDWSSGSGISQILNKPTLGTAAAMSPSVTGAAMMTATSATTARSVIGAGTSSFSGAWADLIGVPSTKLMQSTRTTTGSGGTYTWTFPTAYSATPIIQLTPQDATTAVLNYKITAVSTTAVTVRVEQATAVTILGISVLGVASAGATIINLLALEP